MIRTLAASAMIICLTAASPALAEVCSNYTGISGIANAADEVKCKREGGTIIVKDGKKSCQLVQQACSAQAASVDEAKCKVDGGDVTTDRDGKKTCKNKKSGQVSIIR